MLFSRRGHSESRRCLRGMLIHERQCVVQLEGALSLQYLMHDAAAAAVEIARIRTIR